MEPWVIVVLVWAAAYLVGSIPFGFLVARWRGVDIFQAGSGNIGATNVGRVLGKRFGILVFLLDFAKGAVPVAVALKVKDGLATETELIERGWLEVGAGLAAFLGHLFPAFLRFRGGKGVATGAGVVAVLLPGPALSAVLAWVVVVGATSYVSLGSMVAAVILAGLYFVQVGRVDLEEPRTLFCLLTGILVFVRHRSNIVRLTQGKENQIQGGPTMQQALKVVHVLALGLWFGSAVFFTFVVALSVFNTFETLGQKEVREQWFPLPKEFRKADVHVNGPKEQGVRVAGRAVGPMFHWYFLLQTVCGILALGTALGWARTHAQERVHKWRLVLLLLALATVLLGWALEREVNELRGPRDEATDVYLAATDDRADEALAVMKHARAEFGRWHMYSLFLNFATVLLATAAMALAGRLPPSGDSDHVIQNLPWR